MSFVSEFFDATLTAKMTKTDRSPSLTESAKTDLANLLTPEDSYTYLSIKSDQTYEVVKASLRSNSIYFERGQEGTEAVQHPLGSCVSAVSPLTLAVIKALVCEYECCDGECPCEPVAFQGATMPPAVVGEPWEGTVIFSGTQPIKCGVNNAPKWLTATQQGGVLTLSGTPTAAAQLILSVAAANCNGTEVATETVALNITA